MGKGSYLPPPPPVIWEPLMGPPLVDPRVGRWLAGGESLLAWRLVGARLPTAGCVHVVGRQEPARLS